LQQQQQVMMTKMDPRELKWGLWTELIGLGIETSDGLLQTWQ
jgi:hypothetical protein